MSRREKISYADMVIIAFMRLSRAKNAFVAAMRMVIGWQLAYQGVWALTSPWDYSWSGCFKCAHWIFGGALRALGNSAAMHDVDVCLPWALIATGVLLIMGRAVRVAGALGIIYLALMYILNPPHLGNMGGSHFMLVDRNFLEILMLFCIVLWKDEEEDREYSSRHRRRRL